LANEKLLRVGTSSWSSDDWKTAGFYPPAIEPRDYLAHYARRFDTVEVDSSFYRAPAPSMCARWAAVTPESFRFSLKVPGKITHEKALEGCEREWDAFLDSVKELGSKLAFLLLQFGYFNKSSPCPSLAAFLGRLGPFLEKAAAPCPLVVEVRNRPWIGPDLLALLRAHGAILAVTQQEWMPRPRELFARHGPDLRAAGVAYVRFLGERKRIEALTTTWEKTVIDRAEDLRESLPGIREFLEQRLPVWVYFNNHYAGHAPASVELLRALMSDR
jgi:uncharacterized protein YecE (DUF72 family)